MRRVIAVPMHCPTAVQMEALLMLLLSVSDSAILGKHNTRCVDTSARFGYIQYTNTNTQCIAKCEVASAKKTKQKQENLVAQFLFNDTNDKIIAHPFKNGFLLLQTYAPQPSLRPGQIALLLTFARTRGTEDAKDCRHSGCKQAKAGKTLSLLAALRSHN